jgi:NADH:ubiquinone oxidoreductase subunit 3 (subunit A)
MTTLFAPPLAFLLYLLAGALLMGLGSALAGPSHATPHKRSTYASGEAPPLAIAAQGFGPGFVSALFFDVLHLGVLVVATSGLSPAAGLFLLGLFAALLVLWLE